MEFTKENYLKMNMELYSFNSFLGVATLNFCSVIFLEFF